MEGVCRSFGWYGLAILPGYLVRPLLIGLGVAIWFFAGNAPDAVFVLTLALGITGALALLQVCVMYARLAKLVGVERGKRRTGLWLRASLPLLLVNGIEEIFISSDVLLLGLMGTPDQVALYFATARSMALVNFIYYAFMIVEPRKFSLDNTGQDRNKLQTGNHRNNMVDLLAHGSRCCSNPAGRLPAAAALWSRLCRRISGFGDHRAWIYCEGLGRTDHGSSCGAGISAGQPAG